MTLLLLGCAVLGLLAGVAVDRAFRTFPWAARRAVREPALAGGGLPADEPDEPVVASPGRPRAGPVLLTTAVAVLAGLRFGASWTLPAFLLLAAAGVLLALIDLRHQLLPNRVVVPSIGVTAALLLLPAAVEGAWSSYLRALEGSAVLFVLFLVLALLAPSSLGMGDVKLAALLGLALGWLGWSVLVVGVVAAFVVQAALALVLLSTRRIGRKGQLPFGPAMLLGALIATGWTADLLRGYLEATGRV